MKPNTNDNHNVNQPIDWVFLIKKYRGLLISLPIVFSVILGLTYSFHNGIYNQHSLLSVGKYWSFTFPYSDGRIESELKNIDDLGIIRENLQFWLTTLPGHLDDASMIPSIRIAGASEGILRVTTVTHSTIEANELTEKVQKHLSEIYQQRIKDIQADIDEVKERIHERLSLIKKLLDKTDAINIKANLLSRSGRQISADFEAQTDYALQTEANNLNISLQTLEKKAKSNGPFFQYINKILVITPTLHTLFIRIFLGALLGLSSALLIIFQRELKKL